MIFLPRKSLTIGLFAASLLSLSAEPNGDQVLRQMSEKLTLAKALTFQATRYADPALLPALETPGKAHISAIVERPDKIAVRATNKSGERQFIANGRTLTLVDSEKNYYATIPMRTNIDGLVEVLDKEYSFIPPLADFAVSNPYKDLRRQALIIGWIGKAKTGVGLFGIGGVECNLVAISSKAADAVLWIGIDDHLPHRMDVTFHRAGKPKLKVDFKKWDLSPQLTSSDFVFTPPKGAQKIEMWSTSKMQTHRTSKTKK